MPSSVHGLYKRIVLALKALYPAEEARAMADRLFEHYFMITPLQRVMAGSGPADEASVAAIEEAVRRLLAHVPLQYVTGKAYFMDMEFAVNASVLIPRPETEEMVSLILKSLSPANPEQALRILDIGTGSGCIAIALKHYLPASTVTAADISADAIALAVENAKNNHAAVDFILADILDRAHWDSLPECDLIVSNPPYVTHSEKPFMQPNVLDYEPHTALFVPDSDPLVFYSNIFAFAQTHLNLQGCLWFEINERFGPELKELALNQGFKEANIIFDFRGKSRFLQCFK